MEITGITHTVDSGYARLSADVVDPSGRKSSVYFETEVGFLPPSDRDATPFVAGLLMAALRNNEDIQVDGFVSTQLLQGIESITDILCSWDVGFSKVAVRGCEARRDLPAKSGTGLFFTGGVDSFYSYLRHRSSATAVSHFILVHGYDVGLAQTEHWHRTRSTVASIAAREGIELITIKTNLREYTEPHVSWNFAHGGALAAAALLVRSQFSTVYIASSDTGEDPMPYGTHIRLDHHWSTESLAIVHDGNQARRVEKVKLLAHSDLALSHLRVCWQNLPGQLNCGRCEKCLRTMIELETAGALSRASTFPRTLKPALVRRLRFHLPESQVYPEEDLSALLASGRNPAVAQALSHALSRSRHPTLWARLRRRIRLAVFHGKLKK